ncbi:MULTISPECIES: hypothetical protein [unclassified Rhizobium]|uniref:hypothetical protein n=1 Tax=unclassified Rhizobium TaxID=2613769 RepID=UPI00161582A0|nr:MULTISPECIES: hypothetical protein [unclassified Rhizobium]MBB3287498.1 hypothetical protein [Rhizobium sp. BK252]MBB3402238.1 hypothetical protein [Rhizobium sp. BK289]MBB3414815.1 hypothetical protein [Rhizobium sp. BK284]MBB3482704.1 hypothetical protein [Rhizobium sp. BK347]
MDTPDAGCGGLPGISEKIFRLPAEDPAVDFSRSANDGNGRDLHFKLLQHKM